MWLQPRSPTIASSVTTGGERSFTMETPPAILPADVCRLGGGAARRLLPVRPAPRPELNGRARADSRRHARSKRCHEVRDPHAHTPSDAQSRHDSASGRQACRLLRDLYETIQGADPPGRLSRNNRLGIRWPVGPEQPWFAHPPRTLADHRGNLE